MTLRKSTFAPLSRIFAFAIELDGVDRVLSVVRRHLGMDVAFVARFREEDRVLEHVDESTAGVIFQHQKIPLSEGYCQKVVNGELPELIPDTSLLAAAQEIPETHTIPIGSHLSVPIRLDDNQLFGTLCCFSHQPNPALNVHDMSLLRAFSDLLGLHFSATSAVRHARDKVTHEIRLAMQGN
ncbi:GAF domain-containing protein, partial [Delftia acidovorans]